MAITVAERFINYLNDTDQERMDNIKEGHKKHCDMYGRKTPKLASKSLDMWGAVNENIYLMRGAKFVGCSGHGGVLTSRAVNNAIDEPFRCSDYAGLGVYEEDCDFANYAAYFPGSVKNAVEKEFGKNKDNVRAYFVNMIIDYHKEEEVEKFLVSKGY